MSGGTNQRNPKNTGMPEGFTTSGSGMVQHANQRFVNPTTGQSYTHGNMGATPGEGWEVWDGGRRDQNFEKIPSKHEGREWAEWKNPYGEAKDTRLGMGGRYGGWNPGGGGFGGWNPGGRGGFGGWNPSGQPGNPVQWGGLLGGGQQPGQFPGMNIAGRQQGLLGGGQPNYPGFPGYANLPKNWQDEGYSWNDPNNPDINYNIIA